MGTQSLKNKVGIITFHRAINYGALLQAYALQRVIKNMGCECHVIDYRSECIDKNYRTMTLNNFKTVKGFVKYMLLSRSFNLKKNNFREFISNHLDMTEQCNNQHDLSKMAEKYDILISGSDQVWNYKINCWDSAYFLDFVNDNHKKNAYAASFGLSTIPDRYKDVYKKYLSNFSQISVREQQGKNIVEELVDIQSEVTLDPTFLLAKEDWIQVASEKTENNEYILIYSFGIPKTLKKFAMKLSKKTGCELIFIPVAHKPIKNYIKAKYKNSTIPNEFLSLFHNAKYIVTNSFHGTAFSIIFNKDFFVEKKKESTTDKARFNNILELFDLKDREIINGDNKFIDSSINYKRVNDILNKERNKSLNCIRKIITKPSTSSIKE